MLSCLCQRSNKFTPKRNFQTKKILKITEKFPAPWVSIKLNEKNRSYHFTCILSYEGLTSTPFLFSKKK